MAKSTNLEQKYHPAKINYKLLLVILIAVFVILIIVLFYLLKSQGAKNSKLEQEKIAVEDDVAKLSIEGLDSVEGQPILLPSIDIDSINDNDFKSNKSQIILQMIGVERPFAIELVEGMSFEIFINKQSNDPLIKGEIDSLDNFAQVISAQENIAWVKYILKEQKLLIYKNED